LSGDCDKAETFMISENFKNEEEKLIEEAQECQRIQDVIDLSPDRTEE
jgi:hypothetical protein